MAGQFLTPVQLTSMNMEMSKSRSPQEKTRVRSKYDTISLARTNKLINLIHAVSK